MSFVLDASVVVKWVFDEEGSDRANALRGETGLLAPSLIAAEVGSALWKRVRKGDASRDDALAALQSVLLPFDSLIPVETLHERALAIAFELNHPVYDCFYLALAERERVPIVSADSKLLAAARKMKTVEARKL